jgi:murein DD-endopeptidase MepM/ murein hydrolase activator NlpD
VLAGFEKQRVLSLLRTEPRRRFTYRHTSFNWTPGNMHAQHNDRYAYSLPFARDQHFAVAQGYGGSWSHSGASKYALDFAMPVGTQVHAARSGVVIDLAEHHTKGGADRRYARYANFVTILHDDDTTGEYYHLRHRGVAVHVGDKVDSGDLLGYSGNTGFSSMPHLHFAVYKAKSDGNFESIAVQFKNKIGRQNRK